MDKVARLPPVQRRELFTATAAAMNIQPGLVEKDFWVCWTLKHLFSIPDFKSCLLFKGGTTLSKIFSVIRRFSEDIDLAVDWEVLGFVDERSPAAEMSNTQRTKLLAEMLEACRTYIATDFIETLRKQITRELPDSDSWQLVVDEEERDVINFNYPTATDKANYVRPAVWNSVPTPSSFPTMCI